MGVKGVLFEIGGQNYAIDLLRVDGIENYRNMMVVPNAPACIEGIINLRGKLIPIYNLRTKFHLPRIPATADTKIIVAKANQVPVGYLVDNVTGIESFEDEDLNYAPYLVQNVETEYIKSVAFFKDGLTIFLDTERILTKEERERIWKLIETQKKIVEEKEKGKAE